MRNDKENNRNKLGMNIFSQVLEKIRSAIDFKIERELNQIFDFWAEEVM